MLHLATSSPCSRSEIYAFDNKSNQNTILQQLANISAKIGTQRSTRNVTFSTWKHPPPVASQVLTGCGSAVGKPTKCQPVGGAAEGKVDGVNGAENAVLILISAHVGKKQNPGKQANPRRWMSKVNTRFWSKKGRGFVGWWWWLFGGWVKHDLF